MRLRLLLRRCRRVTCWAGRNSPENPMEPSIAVEAAVTSNARQACHLEASHIEMSFRPTEERDDRLVRIMLGDAAALDGFEFCGCIEVGQTQQPKLPHGLVSEIGALRD